MGLIEDFIARYRKEYDFYDQAARLVAQMLDASLQAAGIRSMVTSRAKSVTRLEAKVQQRACDNPYASVEDIYNDIVDLSGVRVALYFPAERVQVDSIIKSLFLLVGPQKDFPSERKSKYKKRFSGYSATHYRVRLRETTLSDAQKRYAEARVEIQVASVLMHAWAEVEHDLVYKPLQGQLSDDEYAILDELNGLVMAGEIALERLQKAGETRVAAGERAFSNHYDLAAHLLNAARDILKQPAGDTALGRIDLLFDLLRRLGLATPNQLKPYVDGLHGDTERRPLAEQIIDQLLAEDETRYKLYEEIRAPQPAFGANIREVLEPDLYAAMGFFLAQWIAFERAIRERAHYIGIDHEKRPIVPTIRLIEKLGVLTDSQRRELEWIRQIRNNVVHGVEILDASRLREAGERIQSITAQLNQPGE